MPDPKPAPSAAKEPERRDIFTYRILGQPRHADPYKVRRVLHAHLGASLGSIIEQFNDPNTPPEVWSDVSERLYRATCAAFGLEPFNEETGKGLLEKHARVLLGGFFQWENDAAAFFDSRRTSPTPSERPPSDCPTPPATRCG